MIWKLDIKVFKKRTIFVISNIYPSQMLILKTTFFEIKSVRVDKCVWAHCQENLSLFPVSCASKFCMKNQLKVFPTHTKVFGPVSSRYRRWHKCGDVMAPVNRAHVAGVGQFPGDLDDIMTWGHMHWRTHTYTKGCCLTRSEVLWRLEWRRSGAGWSGPVFGSLTSHSLPVCVWPTTLWPWGNHWCNGLRDP